MKDNFSQQAKLYAKYRPAYPPELFDFILSNLKKRDTAWDCATGNGQSAKELAKHFQEVHATDISPQQLEHAEQGNNIIYSLQPAEQTNFAPDSFDLITVSQALHWFDFDKFYNEVKRVAIPAGWLAVWMYALLKISPSIDKLINEYHFETLNTYWDKERKYVDDHYAMIPFPFEEIKCPVFRISYEWTIGDLEGYLATWSALQKFITANNYNPAGELIKKVKPLWTKERMTVVFPVYMRMARIK